MHLDLNAEFKKALNHMEDGDGHLFITGRAGTGKSSLLTYFRTNTLKNLVVLAPTGVAALNVQGQTIHSFFGFPPQISPEQARKEHPFDKMKTLIQKLELIIIDEASMLRADLLDCIDQALRRYGNKDKPFGGKRLVLVGDLYQLPPVVNREEQKTFCETYTSPYFFDAKVFSETILHIHELSKIYRQNEDDFIELLNHVRENSVTWDHIRDLNRRTDPEYISYRKNNEITLSTTNASANEINRKQLKNLKGKTIRLEGKTSGDFQRQLPTEEQLELKVGAQVMMVNNDSAKRWVNGSMGTITGFGWNEEEECNVLLVTLSDGKRAEVLPYTWESNQYFFDPESQSIEMESLGSFTQYPIRLAWAVTIHKSQGKTFDNVIVDIGRGTFAHGQVYVALSRCSSFEGLILRKPIEKKHIWSDRRIHQFMTTNNPRLSPLKITNQQPETRN